MHNNPKRQLWLGTSGLVLPVPNKQAFPKEYQKSTRLTYYASLFNSIEINSSFYKIPLPATFEKWTQEVPDDFRFTVKLHQSITHAPNLHYDPATLTHFLHAAARLANKRGCLLIQFPPSLKISQLSQLENLLHAITLIDNSWQLAVEFRHNSWYAPAANALHPSEPAAHPTPLHPATEAPNPTTLHPATEALLNRFHATLVLHDMPASKIHTPNDTPFTYLRFHGPAGDYKGSYDNKILEEYAMLIKQWQDANKEVYVYFNNTIGDAIANLNTLNKSFLLLTEATSPSAQKNAP